MYTHVYLTMHSKKSKKYNKDRITNIITNMIEFIPSQHFDEVNKNNQASDETKYDYTACQVCYLDFDEVYLAIDKMHITILILLGHV